MLSAQFIIGRIDMNKRQEKIQDEIIKGMYKNFNKLEQRISKLEKVLASHAKCIGEMRGEDNES